MQQFVTQEGAKTFRLNKGLGAHDTIKALGWNVAQHDVSLPCACIYQSRLDNNIAWMAQFAAQSQVKFSPHGKTTMSPQIFKKQLNAGAYAITVATVHQAVIAVAAGAKRVIMANQLIGRANFNALAQLLQQHDIEFYCLVDSSDNVAALGAFFQPLGLTLKILIELGVAGGRCGVVEPETLKTLIKQIKQYSTLQLAGIEVYEGVLPDEASVKTFLAQAVAQCKALIADQVFDTEEVMITAGGSTWYDLVCEAFSPPNLLTNMIPVIRPGCYVAHDQGIYELAQQDVLARSPLACNIGSDLQSCLEIWAYVQSIPQAGRAIIGMGKRDAAFDAGLPIPSLHIDEYGTVNQAKSDWVIEKIMDQHAMLRFDPTYPLKVGDMIAFATSHPCLTFDKWRYINVIDDSYTVVDIFETYF